MLVTLNSAPEGFDSAKHRFQNYGYLHTSYEKLRNAGLDFEDGEDEIGRYDQAIATVEEVLFIIHRYTNPPDESFAIEASEPVDMEDDQGRMSGQVLSYVGALIDKLKLEPGVWAMEPSALKRNAVASAAAALRTFETAASGSTSARVPPSYPLMGGVRWFDTASLQGMNPVLAPLELSPFTSLAEAIRFARSIEDQRAPQDKKTEES
ncbi:hypothetical protein SB778_31080 [Paraburkholderia sp. SIMBA_050]